jgi:DNA-binding NarL/FixJ family response regulator
LTAAPLEVASEARPGSGCWSSKTIACSPTSCDGRSSGWACRWSAWRPPKPEALSLADAERPDLVLVDIGLPGADGLVVGKEIHRRLPSAKLVAVTALDDPGTARKAMTMGFRGYLSKDLPALQFAASIQAIVEGRAIFPRLGVAPTRRTRANGGSPGGPRHLTRREREVLLLLTEGLRGTEIATRLSISPRTVRTYVQSILHKLQVHSRLEAVAVALETGLVDGMRRP